MGKTRLEIENDAADFHDRLMAEQAAAERLERPKPPPRWLLDKWAEEQLSGVVRR